MQQKTISLRTEEKLTIENLMLKITINKQAMEAAQINLRNYLQELSKSYKFEPSDIIDVNAEAGYLIVKDKEEEEEQ